MTKPTSISATKASGFVSRIGYASVGQIVYSLGQLGVLSSLSLLSGPEAAGMFGYALAIVTPIFVLANMGLRTVQVVDQERNFHMHEYVAYRCVTTLLALTLCIIIAFAFVDHPTVRLIVLLYAIAKTFESVSQLSYGTFEASERFDLVFTSLATRSVLTFVAFVSLLFLGAPVWAAFFAQMVVWAVTAFLLDVRAVSQLVGKETQLRPSISISRLMALFRRSAPIGGTGFLSGLQLALLRIFIEAQMGLVALGIFTNISYVFHAGAMLANTIRHVLVARFAKLRVKGDSSATLRIVGFTFLILISLVLLGLGFVYILGEPLLNILFGEETAAENSLFIIVSIALAFRVLSSIPTSLIHAYGGTTGQFLREAFFVFLVIILSQIIIPQVGLSGAGWILVVVSGLRFLADGTRVALRWRLRQNVLGYAKDG